jgi:hypothetical protein
MRFLRVVPVVFAVLGVVFVVPADASGRHKPGCVVPQGWRVVARDRVAVVARGQGIGPDGTPAPAWRYCARSSGRFRLLVQESDMGGVGGRGFPDVVVGVLLAGRYVGYTAGGEDRGENVTWWVTVVDTQTNLRTMSADGQEGSDASPLLLSPTGWAAWIWVVSPSYGTHTGEVRAMRSGGRDVLLDSASVGSSRVSDYLADLQLYGCLGGCAPTTTVVGWTHSGAWRYARLAS